MTSQEIFNTNNIVKDIVFPDPICGINILQTIVEQQFT